MEGDGLGLDLALLHVDLVAAEDDGDVLTDTDQVAWIGQRKYIFITNVSRTRGCLRCQLGTFL